MDASSVIYIILVVLILMFVVFPKIMGMKTPFNRTLDYWIFKKRKPDPRFHVDKEYDEDH